MDKIKLHDKGRIFNSGCVRAYLCHAIALITKRETFFFFFSFFYSKNCISKSIVERKYNTLFIKFGLKKTNLELKTRPKQLIITR
jgi:hypothetical protein